MSIYQDPVQTLANLRSSEVNYRLSLSKLLGCCTPGPSTEPQSQACFSNEEFTKCVRKLIAYHTELVRIIDCNNDTQSNIKGFERWCFMSVKIYHQYLKLFHLRSQDLEMFRELKSEPLIRLEELFAIAQELQLDSVLIKAFGKLHSMNEKKLNDNLMALDLSHFTFSNVKDIHTLTPAFAYFNTGEIVKRDFFKMEMINHDAVFNNNQNTRFTSVELINLQDQAIAICGLLEIGRDLLYPPLNPVDYELEDHTTDRITIIHKEHRFHLIFHGKAGKVSDWRPLFAVKEDKFKHSFYKLTGLNTSGEIGLGLGMNQLRKSRNLLDEIEGCDASSLIENYEETSEEDEKGEEGEQLPPNANVVASPLDSGFGHIPDLPSASKVRQSSSLETKLVVSKPTSQLSKLSKSQPDLTLSDVNKTSALPTKLVNKSTSDLSMTEDTKKKIKRRKSIFGLFKSKEPEFEIVSKDTFVPVAKEEEKDENHERKNIGNADLLFNKLDIGVPESEPEPELSISESLISAQCSTLTSEINDSVILSKWQASKWVQQSVSYEGNKIQFFTSPTDDELHLMQISTPKAIHLIQLHHHETKITKASALNLQIQYQPHQDRVQVDLNLRCINSGIVNKIMNEYLADTRAIKTTINSADGNSIFSDKVQHPSNSTSMSSVSIDVPQYHPTLKNHSSYMSLNSIQTTFALPPKLNFSQLSLHSNPSTLSFSDISPVRTLNELLLRSQLTVKLHQEDLNDREWVPLSMAKMNIFAILSNDDFFRFDICLNSSSSSMKKIDTIVSNKSLKKLGKTGLKFVFVNDSGEEKKYLIEFRNAAECDEIFGMLTN